MPSWVSKAVTALAPYPTGEPADTCFTRCSFARSCIAGFNPKLALSPRFFTSGDNPYIAIPVRTKSKDALWFFNVAAELDRCLTDGVTPTFTN